MFFQHRIALSPGFLSSASWCVAYYKLLFPLTFSVSTTWNLPLPHHPMAVVLNCWVFLNLHPPLSPEMHLLHHLPHFSEAPSFSPIHTFNWPQVASLQLLEHMWAMQQFHFPFHFEPSCVSLCDPLPALTGGTPASSDSRPWHFWDCHTWNPGKRKGEDTYLSTFLVPGPMHGLGTWNPTFKGSSFQVSYWWAPGGSKMDHLNPSAAWLWMVRGLSAAWLTFNCPLSQQNCFSDPTRETPGCWLTSSSSAQISDQPDNFS